MERPICNIGGCHRVVRKITIRKNGSITYGKMCEIHHKKKYGMDDLLTRNRWLNKLHNKPCSRCGWDKASCDLHRIKHGKIGGKYTRKNILILCPNCHRLEHLKKQESSS